MTEPSLIDVLSLASVAGVLEAAAPRGLSNAAQATPPEKGAPFGGLMAALAARAMRDGLDLQAPLRTLTVQFLASARFEQAVQFRPRLARGGRNVAYTGLDADQAGRPILQAMATWGRDSAAEALSPLRASPPPIDTLDPDHRIKGPMAPYFTNYVDFVFTGRPNILGGNRGKPVVERLWMRTKDGLPLDQERLCFLLDALYPPAWTAFRRPPMMTSVDLRYDILTDPTPDLCPDGWAFFEYRLTDHGLGWSMDDCACWGTDGTPLALARQRRKLL